MSDEKLRQFAEENKRLVDENAKLENKLEKIKNKTEFKGANKNVRARDKPIIDPVKEAKK